MLGVLGVLKVRRVLTVLGVLGVLGATSMDAAGDRRLADAVESRNSALVTSLLKKGVDVNGTQPDGATALQWAAHWDDLPTVDLLLRAKASVNLGNDLGVTPLALACENGNAAMVERFLAAGADPNAATVSGITPLMTASRVGSLGAVRALVARGARVNTTEPTRGQTALMWAVSQRHPEVVRHLLENQADVKIRTVTRRRTVQTGSRYGDQNSIKGGVRETDLGGFTAILFAASSGDPESARHLLRAGALVDDVAANGTTALTIAAHSGNGPVGVVLLEHGANPNADAAGYAPIHAAVLRGEMTLLKALVAKGANVEARLTKGTASRYYSRDFAFNDNLIGATPLLLAARYGEPEMMKVLAAGGANVHATMTDGTNLIMQAIATTRGVGTFRAGDRRERYQGPGDVAAKGDGEDERMTLEVARVALGLGLDVNAMNKAGDTALHLAAGQSLDTVIPVLVTSGGKLDIKNKRNLTPLGVASSRGLGVDVAQRQATAELLKKLGAKE